MGACDRHIGQVKMLKNQDDQKCFSRLDKSNFKGKSNLLKIIPQTYIQHHWMFIFSVTEWFSTAAHPALL